MIDGTQLEHAESPGLRMTKELKTDLDQNTRTFVAEMTGRLSKSLRLRKKDQPVNLTASYGFLKTMEAFESECIFVHEMIYDERRRDVISEEQMEVIEDFYHSDGVLNKLMTAVRQLPDFDGQRQASEISRYHDKLESGTIAAPITPLSIKNLSFWQAFKEGKFKDPRAITGKHVTAQRAGKE